MAKKRKDWRRPPFWIVCGMPRGGTSMMMEALIAGGMEAYYTPHDDLIAADKERGFLNNPHDVYEWDYLPKPLPRKLRGKLIKIFPWHVFQIEPGPFRAILIKRDIEQLKASIARYLTYAKGQWGDNINKQVKHAQEIVEREDMEQLYFHLGLVLSHLPTFKDVLLVEYDDVCHEPEKVFTFIKDQGWPIDAEKASMIPNRNWRSKET